MDFGAQSYDLMWEAMTGALIASYTAVSPFFQFTARGLSLFAILVSPVLSLSHWFSIHFDQLVPYHRLCSLVRCIHSFTTPSRSLLSSHFSLVGAALNARASTSLMFLVLCCVFIFRTFSAYIETSVSLLCFFFRVSLSLSLSLPIYRSLLILVIPSLCSFWFCCRLTFTSCVCDYVNQRAYIESFSPFVSSIKSLSFSILDCYTE